MSITQQYLLDSYRARQLGVPAPPAPGSQDWQVVREWRDHRQFHAVIAGRPARGRARRALHRWWARALGRPARAVRPRSGSRSEANAAIARYDRTPE